MGSLPRPAICFPTRSCASGALRRRPKNGKWIPRRSHRPEWTRRRKRRRVIVREPPRTAGESSCEDIKSIDGDNPCRADVLDSLNETGFNPLIWHELPFQMCCDLSTNVQESGRDAIRHYSLITTEFFPVEPAFAPGLRIFSGAGGGGPDGGRTLCLMSLRRSSMLTDGGFIAGGGWA